METLADRINKLIIELGVSKNFFADTIGISSSLISQITTKKNNFRADILQKITTSYPKLNPNWLLNGIGSMWSKPDDLELPKNNVAEKSVFKIDELKKIGNSTEKFIDSATYHGLTSRQSHLISRNREKAKDYFEKIEGNLKGVLLNIDEFVLFHDIADMIINEHYRDLYDVIYNETDYISGNAFHTEQYKVDIQAELEKVQKFHEPLSKLIPAIKVFYKEFNNIDPKKLIEGNLNSDYV